MSLQVWLPLNGDLHNQGLSNITVTNNGATVNTSGKIGSCYSFNGSNQKITGTFSSSISSAIGSLACWVKFNSLPSSSTWFNLMQLGATGGFAACRLGMYVEYGTGINISINGSSTGANYKAYSFSTGTWYHICSVYDGTKVKLYINGVEQLNKTASVGSYTTAANMLFIGGTSSYYLNGYVDDCRYYDHALSTKEIEEIAKGLVLHYKLDTVGLNTLPSQYQKVSFLQSSETQYINSGTDADSLDVDFQYTTVYSSSLHSILGARTASNTQIITVAHYNGNLLPSPPDISVGAQDTNRHTVQTGVYFGNKVYYDGNLVNSYSQQTTCNLNIYLFGENKGNTVTGYSSCKIYQVKLYKNGTIVRDMVPCVRVSDNVAGMYDRVEGNFYTNAGTGTFTVGEKEITIYDCSGYQNNGFLNNVSLNSDTPRYENSMKFSGSTSYIKVNDNNWMAQGASNLTVNIWAYMDDWSNWNGHRLYSCTESGGFNIENTIANSLTFPVCVYTNAAQTSRSYIPAESRVAILKTDLTSGWHMFTYIYTETECQCYLDGILYQTKPYVSYGVYFNINSSRLFLGCEANGVNASGPYFNGQESDFRLYYTALTPEQIKELYNTSMSIDNNGNIYARELVEL